MVKETRSFLLLMNIFTSFDVKLSFNGSLNCQMAKKSLRSQKWQETSVGNFLIFFYFMGLFLSYLCLRSRIKFLTIHLVKDVILKFSKFKTAKRDKTKRFSPLIILNEACFFATEKV